MSQTAIIMNMLIGALVIISGVAIIRFRVSLNKSIQESQRAMFGRRLSRISAGKQTPLMMGVVGVCFAIFGLVMVGAGIFALIASR